MKGKKISLKTLHKVVKATVKAAKNAKPSQSIGQIAATGSHHVNVAAPDAENLNDAFGISKDRAKELDADIINAINQLANSGRLTIAQAIAIATSKCDNDNEVAYAAAWIGCMWGGQDAARAIRSISDQDGTATPQSQSSDASDDSDDDGDDAGGFAAFMAAMQGAGAAAGGAPDDDDDDN